MGFKKLYQEQTQELENIKRNLKAKETYIKKTDIENKKLLKVIEDNRFDFKDITEIELLKAQVYDYKLAFFVLQITNMEDIEYTLKNSGKIHNITFSIERYLQRLVKKTDLVRHQTNGIFYILYFPIKNETPQEFSEKITQQKVLENIKLEFKAGLSIVNKNMDIDRFINEALKDIGLTKTF